MNLSLPENDVVLLNPDPKDDRKYMTTGILITSALLTLVVSSLHFYDFFSKGVS